MISIGNKRIVLIVFTLILMISLIACSDNNSGSSGSSRVFNVSTEEIIVSGDEQGEEPFPGRYIPINAQTYVHINIIFDNSKSKVDSKVELNVTMRNSDKMTAIVYDTIGSYELNSNTCGLSDCQVFSFGERIIGKEDIQTISIVFRIKPLFEGEAQIEVSNEGDVTNSSDSGRTIALEFVDSINNVTIRDSVLTWEKIEYEGIVIEKYTLFSEEAGYEIPVHNNKFEFKDANFNGGTYTFSIKVSDSENLPFDSTVNIGITILHRPQNIEIINNVNDINLPEYIDWEDILHADRYEVILTNASGVKTTEIVEESGIPVNGREYKTVEVRALSGEGSARVNSRITLPKNIY